MKPQSLIALIAGVGITLSLGVAAYLQLADQHVTTIDATLHVATTAKIQTLDSTTYAYRTDAEAIGTILVGLYTHDAHGKAVPAVAAPHPKVSKDQRTYTYHLRNYRWSNGQRVTAQDFVYALRRLVNPKTGSYNAARADILVNGEAIRTGKKPVSALGVKALNQTTLRLRLVHPYPYLKNVLASASFLPINQTFAEKWGKKYGTSTKSTLANGPYRLSGWSGTQDRHWTYQKNPTYFKASRVKVNNVDLKVYANATAAATAYDQGKADYAPLTPQQVPHYTGTKGFKTMATRTEAFVYFNTTTGATTDLWLRKALAQGFNKRLFTQSQLKNGAKPLNGIIPSGTIQTATGEDYRTASGQLLPYNLNKTQSAWTKAKKSLRVNHLTLTLTVSNDATQAMAARFLQSQWQHNLPGLTVRIRTLTLQKRLVAEAKGKFEVVLGTWTPAILDPLNLLMVYQTGNARSNTGFSNAYYDRTVNAIPTAGLDLTKRTALIQHAERFLLVKKVPAAAFYQDGMAYLQRNTVTHLPILSSGIANYEYARMR